MSSASRGLAPREGLECLLVKMGHTGLLAEPRRGLQVGKSGVPYSQNADKAILTKCVLRLPKALVVTPSCAPW